MHDIEFFFFSLPMLIVGLLLINYGLRRYAMLLQLKRAGMTTTGQVVEVQARVDASGPVVPYTVVTFTTKDGDARQFVVKALATLHAGMHVPVIYDPANPQVAELLPLKPALPLIYTETLGLLFLGVAAFMVCLVSGILPFIPGV